MGNVKKISRYLRRNTIYGTIACILVLLGAVMVLTGLFTYLPKQFTIVVMVPAVIILVIAGFLRYRRKIGNVKRAVRREGNADDFDIDDIQPTEYPRIALGSRWFVYHRGENFTIFSKAHIDRAEALGTYEEGRAKSQIQLILSDRKEPHVLEVHGDGRAAAEMINNWLGHRQLFPDIPVTCPFCGNAVNAEDEFCGNCGMKLIRERSVDPFPTQSLNTAPFRAAREPYNDHSKRTALIAVCLLVLAALLMYLAMTFGLVGKG